LNESVEQKSHCFLRKQFEYLREYDSNVPFCSFEMQQNFLKLPPYFEHSLKYSVDLLRKPHTTKACVLIIRFISTRKEAFLKLLFILAESWMRESSSSLMLFDFLD
jgi:hypothetical protein